jgi:hypothetical protein
MIRQALLPGEGLCALLVNWYAMDAKLDSHYAARTVPQRQLIAGNIMP